MIKVLKFSLLFTALITTVLTASASPLEKINDSINVENITSISEIIDPHFYSLAKKAKIDARQRNFLGSWSPDGSRLLIVSAFNPLETAGLAAVYMTNADGTEMKEIASTLNNTRSKSLALHQWSWGPDENRIVIHANIFRVRDFFVIADPDGTLFRVVGKNLTTIDSIRDNILNIEWQKDFSWNPDGTKALVVMGFDPRKYQLYIVDKNGNIKQLTNESIETKVRNPVWSHDGKKIAFNGKNLWVINEDGTRLKQLVQSAENIYAGTVGWNPDDSKIFYQVDRSVRTINADGTGAFEIISGENRTMDDIFSLSPDGQRILFTVSTNEKVASKLYVADSDGRNQKLLLDKVTSRNVISVGWSPKGDKIAFIEDDNLYTINPDGSSRATIALSSYNYAWHPSGDYIAFSSEIDKKTRQVFVARPDGTERVRITQNDQINYDLGGWSPDGSRLLVDSSGYNFDKFDLLVIKFGGYDEIMSLHVPSSVQQGEEFPIHVKSLSKPVENAVVSFNGRQIGITNETGHLNYSFNKTGRYLLNASREGYRVANKLITVKENAQLSEQENITATAVPTAVDTPKVPGFNVIFPIIAFTFIILLRRIR